MAQANGSFAFEEVRLNVKFLKDFVRFELFSYKKNLKDLCVSIIKEPPNFIFRIELFEEPRYFDAQNLTKF